MGQYHTVVNLDKHEYIDHYNLGCGAKLWEQIAAHPGTGAALLILTACSNGRGGGDLDIDTNWHGPERTGAGAGPMPKDYPTTAKEVIGRWAGDRIAVIGDYAEDADLPNHSAPEIYEQCTEEGSYMDISEAVAKVIEHELNGKYVGDGWKDWKAA